MSDSSKVTPAHRQRTAIVYVRQSTLLQLERNKESTARQYDLVERAVALGWSRARVGVVDEDQGHSGSSTVGRSGFAELAAQVWGEGAGEIRLHPDEAVTGVIRAVFERFAACGSARSVWLWLREQDLKWPLQPAAYLHGEEIVWVAPTYHAVHNTLTHPAYAGAYVYGRTRFQRRL